MKNIKKAVYFLVSLAIFFSFSQIALADATLDSAAEKIKIIFKQSEFYKGDSGAASKDVSVVIGKFVLAFLGISGILTLLVFFSSGIIWMTSQGNPTKLQSAKKGMIYAFLGVLIMFSSYALVKYVIENVSPK